MCSSTSGALSTLSIATSAGSTSSRWISDTEFRHPGGGREEVTAERSQNMRNSIRWILLLAFCVSGAAVLSWAFQDADFSVPTEGYTRAIYQAKSELLLPMSILFFAVG